MVTNGSARVATRPSVKRHDPVTDACERPVAAPALAAQIGREARGEAQSNHAVTVRPGRPGWVDGRWRPVEDLIPTRFIDAVNGDDGADGASERTAWKTLGKAMASAPPMAIVKLGVRPATAEG